MGAVEKNESRTRACALTNYRLQCDQRKPSFDATAGETFHTLAEKKRRVREKAKKEVVVYRWPSRHQSPSVLCSCSVSCSCSYSLEHGLVYSPFIASYWTSPATRNGDNARPGAEIFFQLWLYDGRPEPTLLAIEPVASYFFKNLCTPTLEHFNLSFCSSFTMVGALTPWEA